VYAAAHKNLVSADQAKQAAMAAAAAAVREVPRPRRWSRAERRHRAAVVIQTAFRGYLVG
jgi:hypothetical protein